MIKIDKLIESISSYLKIRFDIMKIDLIEKFSSSIANVVSSFVLFFTLLFVLAFASLTLGSILNTILKSDYLGYAIITFIYVIFYLIIHYIAKSGKLRSIIEKEFLK
tara:strand:- start:489 stop:809 length:321 start_codon:yes stop_codon:yes gene_type:complete